MEKFTTPILFAYGAILVIHSMIMIMCFVWIGELKEIIAKGSK